MDARGQDVGIHDANPFALHGSLGSQVRGDVGFASPASE
jgi:hypothetical protein